jgi:hypothetical protein
VEHGARGDILPNWEKHVHHLGILFAGLEEDYGGGHVDFSLMHFEIERV